jgi:purine-nucleoside phosphorylase
MNGETMTSQVPRIAEAADCVTGRCDLRPEAGVITGTGLGGIADDIAVEAALDCRDIPHFPASTVQSHPGRLLLGRLGGRPVAVLQGRVHLYEGYSPLQVTFPVRLLRALGAKTLLLTNASGGLHRRLRPGDVLCIEDHLNLTGENPLAGPNADEWGPRFPDMGRAYDRRLVEAASGIARRIGLPMKTGVYAGLKGPSLETPAEVRHLAAAGADAVGFSTVQEVIAAVHAGFRVAAFSIVTNVHDPEAPAPATLEEIIAVAREAAPGLRRLVAELVGTLDTHA